MRTLLMLTFLAGSHCLPAQELHVSSPRQFEVLQRRTRFMGILPVSGTAASTAQIRVKVEGPSILGPLPGGWIVLHVNPKSGAFSGDLPVKAGGFYTVTVEARDGHTGVSSTVIDHVGVGEVFIVAGQSNATNYGEVKQKTVTGMVTSFSGTAWSIADDPQPGVQDKSTKGSFMPAFGDAMYRRYHVPIGIAAVGHGSTSVRQWLPAGTPVHIMPTMTRYINTLPDGTLVSDGTLFRGMMQRIQQLGPHGFRALLWHQGESDSHQPGGHEIAASTYRSMMVTIIRASRQEAGWKIPWFVAQATYHVPTDRSTPEIREAQRSLWTAGLAYEGPDTDALTMPYRQNEGTGTHMNDAGLKAHGLLWAEKVSPYLDRQLR